jgi:DNA/RNA-binding domain of Phe-tRNA-synthetase-like protein
VLHAAFGADPTTEMAAPERLLRIPLAHRWLPSVSQVVDSYNLASLTTLFALGAHDADRLVSPIRLRPDDRP